MSDVLFEKAAAAKAVGIGAMNPDGLSLSLDASSTNADPALVVTVSIAKLAAETGVAPPTVAAVTYNGAALTRVCGVSLGAAGSYNLEAFVLPAPAAGPNELLVTLSRPAASLVVGAVIASNVHATSTIDGTSSGAIFAGGYLVGAVGAAASSLVILAGAAQGDKTATIVSGNARWNENTGPAATDQVSVGSTSLQSAAFYQAWQLSANSLGVTVCFGLRASA